ncbi:MAG TPA: HAD-IIA family hydrolase [Anaerolineales bacterium]|nr:HAD-IIA family hydrolase [Anaerolineales bacterium]
MLDRLSPTIHGLILDMDGVLWKDTAPIGNLQRIFARMRSLGLKVTMATNNGTITVEQYLEKLAAFDVVLDAWQVVTSAQAAAATLAEAFPDKGTVFVVGENGVVSALCGAGFTVSTDPGENASAIAVVAGLDRSLSYDKLRRAMWHIRAGARFYGTNPDRTFPTPDGPVPGAGSVLAAIQAASGTDPIVIGKPAPFMLKICADRMQLPLNEILVVGDRLETDIAGGQALGARTALVLSGISTQQQADTWKPAPDFVARDLGELVGVEPSSQTS